MNPKAARVTADAFVNGAFGVLDAMLSVAFQTQCNDPAEMESGLLRSLLSQCSFVMQGRVKDSGAAVLMLLPVGDAAKLVALAMGTDPVAKDTLDATELETMQEVADACLGGGLSNFMDRCGKPPAQLSEVTVYLGGPESVGKVSSFVRTAGDLVTFGFNSVGGFDSSGVLVFDQGLEQLVPARLMSDGNSMDNLVDQIQLSESEMSDILSGFGSDAPPPPPAQRPAASGGGDRSIPPNLDMVLDIRLTCTARLGRVDMPIGDILTLGPGSILEVGHLIDEPVELLVNDKLIARGDVVVVDEKFGLRITEIISTVERIESLR